MAAVEAAVRGGCVLGKATVRPSGFWPYGTGWNNLGVRTDRETRHHCSAARSAGRQAGSARCCSQLAGPGSACARGCPSAWTDGGLG